MKFSKGDEVLVKGKIVNIDESDEDQPYEIQVGYPDDPLDWWMSEKTIVSLVKASTAIPEGWTPATVSPEDGLIFSDHSLRNLCLLRADGTQGYGWALRHSANEWKWFGTAYQPEMERIGFQPAHTEIVSDVIAWKELDPEPTPEPELPTIRFKVGDKITNRVMPEWGVGTITKLDMNDPETPYKTDFPDRDDWYWVDEENAVAYTEPEKPTYRLKIGDVIVHRQHPEYGTGTIFELDYHDPVCPYNVTYSKAGDRWTVEENAVLYTEPEPTFRLAIGDKVVYREYVEWGVGEVIELDYSDMEVPYKVNFPIKHDWYWVAEDSAVRVDL